MKITMVLLLLTLALNVWSQEEEYPVITFQKFDETQKEEIDLSDEQIKIMSEASKSHLAKMITDPEELKALELVGVEILLPRTTLFPPTAQTYQARLGLNNLNSPSYGFHKEMCSHFNRNNIIKSTPLISLTSDVNDVITKIEDENLKQKKFNPGQIYFIWGYNRGWHSKSDATFTTNDGTFTIKDAHGDDRPSPFDPKIYFNPATMSIPQYNFRLGYQLTPKWSIEAGMDHMKWVFDNSRIYEIEGNYDRTLYVRDPNDPHNLFGLDFDQVKQSGNASWLNFEHTDGYNYAFVAGVYKQNLIQSKNEKFKIDALGGAGMGLMIPQTSVRFHQDQWWNWEGLDNRFHIAGFGGHAEGKLRITYGPIFAEAAGRYTLIKVNNALVNDQGARLEHTPISSFQFIGAVGVQIPIDKKKKKTVP